MALIETENLTKVYGTGEAAVTALDGVTLQVNPGEFVAVMGPSGCGKSTLLHLIGGLDRPTKGKVTVDGIALADMMDDDLAKLRRKCIGFVFQFFNLIPVLDAAENAALPVALDGAGAHESKRRAVAWLQKFGLGDRIQSRPDQLSGGQQQRVAIARALAADPALILADEPTGNLDTRAADEIAALLARVSREFGRAVVMVTHDPRIAAYANRIIFLKDGAIVDETVLDRKSGDQSRILADKMREIGE